MAAEELHDTVNLSGQGLKRLPKSSLSDVSTLILDNNELQRWDNIDSYPLLKKLSVTHNQLLRMYGVGRLHGLTTLNLSHNSILTIEGLKDLVHLKWLCLASNNIKTIEHLNTNINLEHLDLSENSIVHVSNLSHLKNLKQLLLHGNRISQLRQCERHLPPSIVTLTLASNNITDLNEMSHLVHLTNLREFTIMSNPCVNMTGNCVGFDYRPFVINWCMSLKVIDGFVVDAIESLKAEWLYSQGRGRQFRVGEHQALVQYLASVCPLTGDSLETEDDRKLRLILSKAQQHQQQLREQLTDGMALRAEGISANRNQSAPLPPARRRISSARNTSPRRTNLSKLPITDRGRQISPERMVNSCHTDTSGDMLSSMISTSEDNAPLMTRSLDPTLLYSTASNMQETNNSDHSEGSSSQLIMEDCTNENGTLSSSCPLQAATKLVPVPESLMSPDYRPALNSSIANKGVRPKSAIITGVQNKRPIPRGSPKLPRSLHSSPLLSRQRGAQGKQCSVASSRRRSPPQRAIGVQETAPVNSSEDEDSEMSASKLETIRHRAQERWQKKEAATTNAVPTNSAENAAVCIQRMWRGYHTRNLNRRVRAAYQDIQATRTQEYIQKLSSDMEATRTALENERKLQLLQMQAITALWKKVSSLQPALMSGDGSLGASTSSQQPDPGTFRDLTETCTRLHSQVAQLQDKMQSVMHCMSMFCQQGQAPAQTTSNGTGETKISTDGTQTEIIAVHTPQTELGPGMPFPYQRVSPSPRPSSLPISQSRQTSARNSAEPEAPQELKQFATSLVDDVLRTVAEQDGENEAETGDPLDGVEVNGTVRSNGNAEDEKKSETEMCDLETVKTEHESECTKEELLSNGNLGSSTVTKEDAAIAVVQLNGLSLDERSSCIMIRTEPPSTPSSPFEQLDSPNNNQRPIHGNAIESQ